MQPNITMEYTRNFSLGDLPEDQALRSAAPQPGSSKVFAQFYTTQVKDEARSLALGRVVHKDIEMIRIIIPGDRHNIVERRVREHDKLTYSRQYEAFKKAIEFVPDGTRLEDWPVISRSQVLDLKTLNIFTVEQIAALSDEQLVHIGIGARMLRKHAQAFLETAEKGRVPAALVAENESLRNQVTLLTNQIDSLAKKMEQLMIAAGQRPENADTNPVVEARVATQQIVGAKPGVQIPDDFRERTFLELKKFVSEFSVTPVRNRAEAIEVIEEYLGRSAAVA